MKIAIVGYGKLGKEIEKAAEKEGVEVSAIIDIEGGTKDVSKDVLKDVDVVIEATAPEAAISNIRKVAALKKNIVVATTGWYDSMEEVERIIEKHKVGFIYSPNFSLGVNAFFKIVEESAKLFNKLEAYDLFAFEGHHNQKADSPSGTARAIGDILLKNIDRKKGIVYDKLERKIKPNEFHVASFRSGYMPGTHVVGFDGEGDTIELKHTARSRAGFAHGTVLAAKWIHGKKGFYTLDDFTKELFD
ncbi:MAG: 4-hydroxy-tetrahydrodipicolinate reductase [bacterium]|nr:4-hydroxy-tetrahydrodipicolinate reductase [bacterium]